MDVHKLENITIGLEFCKTFFPVTFVRSQDVIEGNKKLILGLFWQMILHFQVLGGSDENESGKKDTATEKQRKAKQKLLEWCQDKTKGHKGVNIADLSTSWHDGLGFCALVHAYDPSYLNFDSLDPSNVKGNLELAFRIAEEKMDIPQFLDPNDIIADEKPDEQCFMTYLSEFPLAFLHKAGKDLDRNKEEEEKRRREEEERRKRELEEERSRYEAELRRKAEEEERRRIEEEKRRAESDEKARLAELEKQRALEEEQKKSAKAAKKADKERLAAEEEARKRQEAELAFEEERKRLAKQNEELKKQLDGVKKKLIGRLQVTIIEARGLPKSDHLGGKSDPYCVLFLERQKEKTRTVKRTLNPKWQAEFEFFVSDPKASLEVSVFDWNRILSDELIGKVDIPVASLEDGKKKEAWYQLEHKESKKKDSPGEIRLTLLYNLQK